MQAKSIEIVERERERERAILKEKIAFINSAKNKERLSYNKERTRFVLLYDDLSFL